MNIDRIKAGRKDNNRLTKLLVVAVKQFSKWTQFQFCFADLKHTISAPKVDQLSSLELLAIAGQN